MKQIKPIFIIIAALAVIMLIINFIGQCTAKRNTEVLVQSEVALTKQKAIDSVKTAEAEKAMVVIDSLQLKSDSVIAQAKKNAAYWEKIANKRGREYAELQNKADSLAVYADTSCFEVIEAFRDANLALKQENEALTNKITDVEIEAQEWCEKYENSEKKIFLLEGVLVEKDKTISQQEQTITEFEKRLRKSNTWLQRHKEKVGFGAGLIFGILL